VKGYRTLEAESAEAAVVAVQETDPDLVLIGIPGMNSIEAFERLRQRESTGAVPALAFGASVMPRHRSQVTAAGFDGFIAKLSRLRKLGAKIVPALRKRTG
jgi:CheY-like chemotaxis protein